MVFFICEKCGEVIKKKQVCKHFNKCNSNAFSCIDCQKNFDTNTYNEHIKCISEDQKYGGANFIVKENKGELRQNSWVQQVSQAINNVKDRNLRKLLSKIQGYDNVPRKEKKFINFMQSCLQVRNQDLCQKAWNAIKKEAEEIKLKKIDESEKQIKNIEIKETE